MGDTDARIIATKESLTTSACGPRSRPTNTWVAMSRVSRLVIAVDVDPVLPGARHGRGDVTAREVVDLLHVPGQRLAPERVLHDAAVQVVVVEVAQHQAVVEHRPDGERPADLAGEVLRPVDVDLLGRLRAQQQGDGLAQDAQLEGVAVGGLGVHQQGAGVAQERNGVAQPGQAGDAGDLGGHEYIVVASGAGGDPGPSDRRTVGLGTRRSPRIRLCPDLTRPRWLLWAS